MPDKHLKPGLIQGFYPQKQESWPSALESRLRLWTEKAKQLWLRKRYNLPYLIKQINVYESGLENLKESELNAQISQLRINLHRHGLQDKLIFQAFAIIREVSRRVLGKKHFDVQLLGGWVMMNGMIAEMQTGEGKTLTATLASCTAALAGIPVHVVTANDYLVSRDEELLRPLYEWLGISSAIIIDGMDIEPRKHAYRCDIVHATGQQIAFDYLRDRLEMGDEIGKLQIQFRQIQYAHQQKSMPYLLRGLCFVIIDEADSLLIDEAKTPLIISKTRHSDTQNQIYFDALCLVNSLDKETDFILNKQYREVLLTAQGKIHLEKLVISLGDYWQSRRRREVLVNLALKAKYLFDRDEHYLLRDGKVVIIDALTGRIMPDRSWEQGLHQLIEIKENCDISCEREPLARISYQKFFKRYLHLAGMSGTVKEVATELNSTYGLQVMAIPTNKPSIRQLYPVKVYKSAEQKWQCFISTMQSFLQHGRPVLVGTRSVADSEQVSALLSRHNLHHQVLNANQDKLEAQIIARAGQINSITVATNLAGRGTDIALSQAAKALGGLHVILTSRNDSKRIDRQLIGRCARQGDPGSVETIISLEDAYLANFYPTAMLHFITKLSLNDQTLPCWIGNGLARMPQKWTESRHEKLRRMLVKQELQQAELMAFTGRME